MYIMFKSTCGFLSQACKSRCSSNIEYEILSKLKYGISTFTALLVMPYIQLHSVIPCIKCPRRSKYKTATTCTCMFVSSCKCELHVESLYLNNRSFVLHTRRQLEIKQGYCKGKIRKRLGLHKFIWSFAGNVAPCIFHLCNHIINNLIFCPSVII